MTRSSVPHTNTEQKHSTVGAQPARHAERSENKLNKQTLQERERGSFSAAGVAEGGGGR